jgi:methionine-rich copper-binding protein CopC
VTASAAQRRAVRLLPAVVALVLASTVVPPAAAHDELLFSDPSEAGMLRAMPSRAILTFNGPVAEVHEVTVTGPDGSVANGTPTAVGPEVRQNLWAGPDGAYTLTYDVVSSDGHEMAGEVRFEVGDGTPDEGGAAATSAPDADDPDGVLRGIVVPAGMVLLSGAGALAIWQRRRAARGADPEIRAATPGREA